MGKPKLEGKKTLSFKITTKKRPTLKKKKLQEKKYPFSDSDLSGMLDLSDLESHLENS